MNHTTGAHTLSELEQQVNEEELGYDKPPVNSEEQDLFAMVSEDNEMDMDDDDGGQSETEDGEAQQQELDPQMMNELLLVCSNLGIVHANEEGDSAFTRGEDCIEWIHDLQRAIRRDHAKLKLVTLTLGRWKVLQNKLIPLLINHQDDWTLVFPILKVLVMLTMKLPADTFNLEKQFRCLRGYKEAFLQKDLVHLLMYIISGPLSKEKPKRSEQDYLIMELILTLFRNLLAIPNENVRATTSSMEYLAHLQEDLILVFHGEKVFDLILLIAQDIGSNENKDWNLLLMEIVELVVCSATPESVIQSLKQQMQDPSSTSTFPDRSSKRQSSSSLLNQIKQEKKNAKTGLVGASSRHSNFGGVLSIVAPGGKRSILTNLAKDKDDWIPQAKRTSKPRRGKKKKSKTSSEGELNNVDTSDIFRGNIMEKWHPENPMRQQIMLVILKITDSFVEKCYFPMMNSLKNEFRRGSGKLLPHDRIQYFRLVWFLSKFHRLKQNVLEKQAKAALKEFGRKRQHISALENIDLEGPKQWPGFSAKELLATMDMFSFNFVLHSIEHYIDMKNYAALTVSVRLLTEMMAILSEMGSSKDLRYRHISESLEEKLFYERESLDRLPALLRIWSSNVLPDSYAVDVVTMTHLVLKMLDKGSVTVLSKRKSLKTRKKKSTSPHGEDDDDNNDDDDENEKDDRQERVEMEMQRKELQLNTRKYFTSLINADNIQLYCRVLSNYATNSVKVNHFVHSFFHRVKHCPIDTNDKNSTEKATTFAPLLYNIKLLFLYNKILNDPTIQRNPQFPKELHDFIKNVVRDFFALAETNHLLFVEVLVKQSYAPKTCAMIQRRYREPTSTLRHKELSSTPTSDEKEKASADHQRMNDSDFDGEEEFTFEQQSKRSHNRADEEDEDEDEDHQVEEHHPWTQVEDSYLKKKYQALAHESNVYELLLEEDMFTQRDRTMEQIKARVHFLLLTSTHALSGEEEKQQSDASADRRTDDKPKRKNVEKLFSGDSDDDSSSESEENDEIPERQPRRKRLLKQQVESDSEDEFEAEFSERTTKNVQETDEENSIMETQVPDKENMTPMIKGQESEPLASMLVKRNAADVSAPIDDEELRKRIKVSSPSSLD